MLLIVEALRSAAPLRRECFCFWLTFNQFIQKLPTVIVLIMQIYVWYNWIIIIDAFITSTVTMELTATTLHTDGALITHLHLSLVTCQIKKWKLPVIVLSPKGQKTSTDDSFSYSWRLLYCNPQCSSAVTTCHTRTHQNPPEPTSPPTGPTCLLCAAVWPCWSPDQLTLDQLRPQSVQQQPMACKCGQLETLH